MSRNESRGKTDRINLRMPADIKDALTEAAKEQGYTVTELIEILVLKEIRRYRETGERLSRW